MLPPLDLRRAHRLRALFDRPPAPPPRPGADPALHPPPARRLTRLIDLHHLGNGSRWLDNWRRVWNDNLATCREEKPGGERFCTVQLS
jgi:hypothetical protein